MESESESDGEDPMELSLDLSLGLPNSKANVIGNGSTALSSPSPWNLLLPLPLPLPFPSPSDKSLAATGEVGADVACTGPPLPGSMGIFVDQPDDVSSPNSTVSSVSAGKHENDAERTTSCSRGSDEDDGGGVVGGEGRKKLRLSRDQSVVLEETFKEHSTLNPKQKQALADRLNLRPRQVEVWFQNRRARTKLKQTEVDCEYLKWCCENLTQENRRLQKEVQELRALKLNPQLYMNMNMNPPTTLTMCPSCERMATFPSSSSSPTSAVPVGSLSAQQSSISVFP